MHTCTSSAAASENAALAFCSTAANARTRAIGGVRRHRLSLSSVSLSSVCPSQTRRRRRGRKQKGFGRDDAIHRAVGAQTFACRVVARRRREPFQERKTRRRERDFLSSSFRMYGPPSRRLSPRSFRRRARAPQRDVEHRVRGAVARQARVRRIERAFFFVKNAIRKRSKRLIRSRRDRRRRSSRERLEGRKWRFALAFRVRRLLQGAGAEEVAEAVVDGARDRARLERPAGTTTSAHPSAPATNLENRGDEPFFSTRGFGSDFWSSDDQKSSSASPATKRRALVVPRLFGRTAASERVASAFVSVRRLRSSPFVSDFWSSDFWSSDNSGERRRHSPGHSPRSARRRPTRPVLATRRARDAASRALPQKAPGFDPPEIRPRMSNQSLRHLRLRETPARPRARRSRRRADEFARRVEKSTSRKTGACARLVARNETRRDVSRVRRESLRRMSNRSRSRLRRLSRRRPTSDVVCGLQRAQRVVASTHASARVTAPLDASNGTRRGFAIKRSRGRRLLFFFAPPPLASAAVEGKKEGASASPTNASATSARHVAASRTGTQSACARMASTSASTTPWSSAQPHRARGVDSARPRRAGRAAEPRSRLCPTPRRLGIRAGAAELAAAATSAAASCGTRGSRRLSRAPSVAPDGIGRRRPLRRALGTRALRGTALLPRFLRPRRWARERRSRSTVSWGSEAAAAHASRLLGNRSRLHSTTRRER